MSNAFRERMGEVKPREQMELAPNPHDVSDEALLAVLLKTGAVGCDVMELSRRLLAAFGSLRELMSSDWRMLEERIRAYNRGNPKRPILGVGHVKCLELAAAFELGYRRSRLTVDELFDLQLSSAEDAARVFRSFSIPEDRQENLFVLPLDARRHPISCPVRVSRGTERSTPVCVRDVFREAVRWGAPAVVVAHNHPGGNTEPSQEDVIVTQALVAASELIGIQVLDHLVFDGENFVSMSERGVIR